MAVLDNPVLQRELLVNLRLPRSFGLLLAYQVILALVVYFAWPQSERLDLTTSPAQAQFLVNLFFVGQYILTAMMVPAFTAGAITGEKERLTYEMLLASPIHPIAIVVGKLVASLTQLAVLIFASLPIVMLCLPLGGVSPYELLAAYVGLMFSVLGFGAICMTASSYFRRTSAALVVSYLVILPLASLAVLVWLSLAGQPEVRLFAALVILPVSVVAVSLVLLFLSAARMLHPPDVGSEGKDVVDIEDEAQRAVGLVINPNQFPDRLFAPAKRNDLMEDGANPVFDKEIRSEIFSQGTLMLRLVVQVSMLLAIVLMAVCLYLLPEYAAFYVSYVLVFNMLVGPVFTAGSVTSERERQTLDLLLTTMLTPWQILSGKLVAGLRVSAVLTAFLALPIVLAALSNPEFWRSWVNEMTALLYLIVIAVTCLTSSSVALLSSVVMRRTSSALMMTYGLLMAVFIFPLAVSFFAVTFFPADRGVVSQGERADVGSAAVTSESERILGGGEADGVGFPLLPGVQEEVFANGINLLSPFAAAFSLPLHLSDDPTVGRPPIPWLFWASHLGATLLFDGALVGLMAWLFHRRWRVAE